MESAVVRSRAMNSIEIDKFEQNKPFVVYTPILIAINYAALASRPIGPSQVILLIIAGLLSWGLIEYVVHRFVLHRNLKADGFNLPGTETHLTHHRNPRALDRVTVQLSESAPVAAVHFALAWVLTGSWQMAVYVQTGMMAGYFFYESLDFMAHHGTPRTRLGRYFKKYHLLHHHLDATARFGVTSPIFDYLFGTYHVQNHRLRR